MSDAGPLSGVRIIEFAGIGPAPFAAMLLAQMGAQVLRIERTTADPHRPPSIQDHLDLGRQRIALDLKDPEDRQTALDLAAQAEIAIEGFRPAVMERLGLGPDALRAASPAIVYGRMTGWGQTGPRAQEPGHDINYLALSGALHSIGPRGGAPVVPLNLVADFGGGALYLVAGILAALIEARTTGQGRIVDAAMVDGAASLMTMHYGFLADGRSNDRRGDNRLDGAHPCYTVYQTRDGAHLAVGALEERFYRALIERLGLDPTALPDRSVKASWPILKAILAKRFRTRNRAEWEAVFSGSEACVTPILSLAEAPLDPHATARESFTRHAGAWRPRPGAAPRFSASEGGVRAGWQFTAEQHARLIDQ